MRLAVLLLLLSAPVLAQSLPHGDDPTRRPDGLSGVGHKVQADHDGIDARWFQAAVDGNLQPAEVAEAVFANGVVTLPLPVLSTGRHEIHVSAISPTFSMYSQPPLVVTIGAGSGPCQFSEVDSATVTTVPVGTVKTQYVPLDPLSVADRDKSSRYTTLHLARGWRVWGWVNFRSRMELRFLWCSPPSPPPPGAPCAYTTPAGAAGTRVPGFVITGYNPLNPTTSASRLAQAERIALFWSWTWRVGAWMNFDTNRLLLSLSCPT